MVVRVNRRLLPSARARELTAAVGNHLVDVHVELRAAARHPDMQREHVVVLAGEDLVAGLHDQAGAPGRPAPTCVIDVAAAFFSMAYAVIISRGIRSWPMLKCSSERCVCAPQSLSAGPRPRPDCRFLFEIRSWNCSDSKCDAQSGVKSERSKMCARLSPV